MFRDILQKTMLDTTDGIEDATCTQLIRISASTGKNLNPFGVQGIWITKVDFHDVKQARR